MKKISPKIFAFYFFTYFFLFRLFILSGCFRINPEKTTGNESFSNLARYLTCYDLVRVPDFFCFKNCFLIKIIIYIHVEFRVKYKTTFLEIILE